MNTAYVMRHASACVIRHASAYVMRHASACVMRRASLTAMLVAAAACSGGSKSASDKHLSIAVIPKGTSHEFWKSIHAGAIQAAQELSAAGDSVQIIWKGPL